MMTVFAGLMIAAFLALVFAQKRVSRHAAKAAPDVADLFAPPEAEPDFDPAAFAPNEVTSPEAPQPAAPQPVAPQPPAALATAPHAQARHAWPADFNRTLYGPGLCSPR
jgi:hypothetical protein